MIRFLHWQGVPEFSFGSLMGDDSTTRCCLATQGNEHQLNRLALTSAFPIEDVLGSETANPGTHVILALHHVDIIRDMHE
ncbi:hypothetical protein HYQ46_012517 [Verticillium longisporum]|nr:hypothetical protein HYQ46_012517 [Verticillium longisporum]